MFVISKVKIRSYEVGLHFRDGEFQGLLYKGNHWFFDPWNKAQVEKVSLREPYLYHEQLDLIAKSGTLAEQAVVLDLTDYQRALVWVDGRFDRVLGSGLHVLWKTARKVEVEVVDAREIRVTHRDLNVILGSDGSATSIRIEEVREGTIGVLYTDGDLVGTLKPGRHAFWMGVGRISVFHVELRESVMDIAGQEIMTADKVTLRMNAVLTYRVTDAKMAISTVEDFQSALYREAQLALRAVVGTKDLDTLLADKDGVLEELEISVKNRATAYGVEVSNLGIRDVILPGEMKVLLNKVTEARKAAEASLIRRREETAAMRSQANTAKLLEGNPTLMRLRELEVLEKISEKSNLNIVLGEKGLADRVVNLL